MKQIFVVDNLPKAGFELTLKATDQECIELAAHIGAEHVANFTADLFIKQWRRGGVYIEGKFSTQITQLCSLSLEPFEVQISEKIDQKFFATTKLPSLNDKNEGEMLDNDLDPPEALIDGNLDIFDYLAENLLLQLDPYPKKPGSQLPTADINGKYEINQPTGEDSVETIDQDGNVSGVKPKTTATHKPFADLSKLLKDQ